MWKLNRANEEAKRYRELSAKTNPTSAFFTVAAESWESLIGEVSHAQAIEGWWRDRVNGVSAWLDAVEHKLHLAGALKAADKLLLWMPGFLGPLVPTGLVGVSPLDPYYISYAGGFMFGALQAALQQFVGIPGDVLRLIGYCLSHPNILNDLKTGLAAMVTSFAEINHLAPYERGRAIGGLVVSLIAMFFLAKGIASFLRKLPGRLGAVAENMKALAGTVKAVAKEVFPGAEAAEVGISVSSSGAAVIGHGTPPKLKINLKAVTAENIKAKWGENASQIRAKASGGRTDRASLPHGMDNIWDIDQHPRGIANSIKPKFERGIRDSWSRAHGEIPPEVGSAKNPVEVPDGTGLSKMAKDYRIRRKVPRGRDVAIFMMEDGRVCYVTSGGEGETFHAEEFFKKVLMSREGIDPTHIKLIYTELTPCLGIGSRWCVKLLEELRDLGCAAKIYATKIHGG